MKLRAVETWSNCWVYRATHKERKMSKAESLPAAAYLRRSSGNYGYSIEEQRDVISQYAAENGFHVIREYLDVGKSGLTLRGRLGFKTLISEVVSGKADFVAILIYDVSRWGRFQDFDEGAYYEHLCSRFGIKLHYCAERFRNDGSVQTGVVKYIKRVEAAQYSRDLSKLVLDCQKGIAAKGFRQGGAAGYGLRRAAIDRSGRVVAVFSSGEYKERTYRCTLVPGPIEEIRTIQRVYSYYVDRLWSIRRIAKQLNAEGVRRDEKGRPWTFSAIKQILTNEKYVGCMIFNKFTESLGRSTRIPNDRDVWVVVPDAYVGLVDHGIFAKAAAILKSTRTHLTDEEALDRIRWLVEQNIVPTQKVLTKHPAVPSPAFYAKRFGSLSNAYRLSGYDFLQRRPTKSQGAMKRRIEFDDLAFMGTN